MNVTTTSHHGRVHYPATSGTRPQCTPSDTRSTYRTTDAAVTCDKCRATPAILGELWDVVQMAHGAVTLRQRTETRTLVALERTEPGTAAYLITQSALHAVRASQRAVEQAWHAAAAAYIARARALRAPGRQFPLERIETDWADLPKVAALLAAHDAN